jgi:hypothetical protein
MSKPAAEWTPEDAFRWIVVTALADPHRGVPCIIGPPQYGKTHDLYALYRNMGMVLEDIMVFNPQTDLPEDIAGWPYREGDKLYFTQPANIRPDLLDKSNYDEQGNPKKKWGIIVDELDKAPDSVLTCFLTLFNPDERRLRHTRISHKVPIVAAMNEPDGRLLPEPLVARMLFLPYPMEGMNIAGRSDLKPVQHIAEELFRDLPAIKFPARPKAPGSLHKLRRWLTLSEFWECEHVRKLVVHGLFPQAQAGAVLQALKNRTPNPTKEWAAMVSPTDFAAHILDVLNAGEFQDMSEVIVAITERANEQDPTEELTRILVMLFESPETLHSIHRPEFKEQGAKVFADKIKAFMKEQRAKGGTPGVDTGAKK